MKNRILFVGNKQPKWLKGLENDFEISKQKNSLKAFKEVFKTIPDLIVFCVTDSFYEGYYLSKLLSFTEETNKIPFIITNSGLKVPENIDFNAIAQIDFEIGTEDVEEIINKIISENKLSKPQKNKILKNPPSSKELKFYMERILDELLVNSSIVEEFKSLIDSMSFDNVLVENVFKIINRYIKYDVAGIFINNPDEASRNVLNLSIPNNNITLDMTSYIRDEFFDEIEKYKRVNEIQCNLTNGDVSEKSDITPKSFKMTKVIPYKYGENLTGGIFFCSTKPFDMYESAFFEIIIKELDVIFKLKYLFDEQARHAFIDPMTGLYNRQLFESNLENEFYRARRYIFNFTLAMLDVDYLSKINDEYGKEFGDYVLTELSTVLKQVFRRTDLIYRYGGEEIIIYLPSTPITKALIPIERLRANIANHTFEKNGIKTNVTVSVGLCANYSKFTEPNQLLDGVANAMMRAKERGRNKVDIFE